MSDGEIIKWEGKDPDPEYPKGKRKRKPGQGKSGDPNPDGYDDEQNGHDQPSWSDPYGSSEEHDSFTDNESSSGDEDGSSLKPEHKGSGGAGATGEWVTNDPDTRDEPTGVSSEPHMGQDGYGDYWHEADDGTVVNERGDTGVWYDNEGEVYFENGDGTMSDLNGHTYVVSTDVNGITTLTQDTGGDPGDVLDPDWNDPGDDDSWVDNYDDLPTDEDGDVDFSSTFGLDDGE